MKGSVKKRKVDKIINRLHPNVGKCDVCKKLKPGIVQRMTSPSEILDPYEIYLCRKCVSDLTISFPLKKKNKTQRKLDRMNEFRRAYSTGKAK